MAHAISPLLTFNTFDDFIAASAASIAHSDVETLSGVGRLADAVVVAVHDRQHKDCVVALAAQGYHILCEKPMATSPEDCIEMADAARKGGKIFGIGHGESVWHAVSRVGYG
jgi:predicted dehydrogenase